MCFAINLPLIWCECAIKWAMLEKGKIGYWVVASDTFWHFPASCALDQAAGLWQIQEQEGRKQSRSSFQLGVQRGWSIGHILDLLLSISFLSWTLNYTIELDYFKESFSTFFLLAYSGIHSGMLWWYNLRSTKLKDKKCDQVWLAVWPKASHLITWGLFPCLES